MKSLLIISGWAHGIEAIRPLGDALSETYDIQLMTGAEVLKSRAIPDSDYIVTGSMGGLLAMELLPASCEKLVLVSSTAKFCADAAYPCGTNERILRRMIAAFKRNPEAVLRDFLHNTHYPNKNHTSEGVANLKNAPLEGLEYLLASDVRSKVPSIEIPTLLLHGREDRIIPVAAAEWLHTALPNSELKIFEDDGHALLAHHFEESITLIRGFLTR